MALGARRRLRILFRVILPGILCSALIIISTVNWGVSGLSTFMPSFITMVIFYWGIYLPHSLPKWMIFLIGLAQDVMMGTPLGVSSFVLILLFWGLTSQRGLLIKEPFSIIWVTYALSDLATKLLAVFLYSLLTGANLLTFALFMQWLLSVLLYPFMHFIFAKFHANFLKRAGRML